MEDYKDYTLSFYRTLNGKRKFIQYKLSDKYLERFDWHDSIFETFKTKNYSAVEFSVNETRIIGFITENKITDSEYFQLHDGSHIIHTLDNKNNPFEVSYAIISATNPYRTSDVEYSYVLNDGISDALMNRKEFKRVLKRTCDNFASRKFREHCGGDVHKIYKDKNLFIEDFKKLTGCIPKVE